MTLVPALPGYYPDPSICRVGDEYFLVNSSFEYAPGVPIHRSRDLVTWTQIGNVLTTPAQLTVHQGIQGASGGIYAPTLRHHDGRFWMITTNIHEIALGHLLVHAKHPEGPWSDPVRIAGLIGIDPDIAWGEDGTCYVTWSDVVRGGISQATIDIKTGAVLSEPRPLWAGTGGAHPEGPHLIKRAGWWYLLVAEGGTGRGHMVTVARSRRPDGPFEPAPQNPILTRRSTGAGVQSTGHSDLVELVDGSWALVFLATRPRGSFPRWHTNGRETFIAGVEWIDDWPVVDETRFDVTRERTGFSDSFEDPTLHPRWISPGIAPGSFSHPAAGGLELLRGRDVGDRTAKRLLAVRVQDETWSVCVEGSGDLALSVRMDDDHQALVERVAGELRVRVVVGPLDQIIVAEKTSSEPVLSIRAIDYEAAPGARRGPDLLLLGYMSGEEFVELTRVDGRYLSAEVAGGFTGRVVGVEALADGVAIRRFSYEPLEGAAR